MLARLAALALLLQGLAGACMPAAHAAAPGLHETAASSCPLSRGHHHAHTPCVHCMQHAFAAQPDAPAPSAPLHGALAAPAAAPAMPASVRAPHAPALAQRISDPPPLWLTTKRLRT